MRTLILSAEDIAAAVRHVGLDALMDEVIAALHAACDDQHGIEAYDVPKREGFSYDNPAVGLLEWMPLLKRDVEAFIKLVGYHPNNPWKRGLPTVLSSLLKFDTTNGHLGVVADGTLATAIRTGAASAVASRILASPGSSTLGLIGAGAQAVTQLHALSRLFPIREVYVCDIDVRVAQSFARRVETLQLDGVRFHICAANEVARAADILCTATSVAVGGGPVFEDGALSRSVHINAVGSDFPGKTELPRSLLDRALVCPDYLPQAAREGECQALPPEQLGPDLMQLVRGSGQYAANRTRTTVFDSTGFALEDYVVLGVLERIAAEIGLGLEVEMESRSDPHDPYAGLAGSLVAPLRIDMDLKEAVGAAGSQRPGKNR